MARHPAEHEIDLAPTDELVRADYNRDFYSWLMEQAGHVRAGRWDAIDRGNLAEEIEWGANNSTSSKARSACS